MSEPAQLSRSQFERDGFIVLRDVVAQDLIEQVRELTQASIEPLVGPAEFEADVGYPGAPDTKDALGGKTPRRLLHAYARDEAYRRLCRVDAVTEAIEHLLGEPPMLSQCHHNCVMTKHPGYSSATLWHQDIRYWNFDRPELISAWFALGEEHRANGSLRVIPGTHSEDLDRGRFDKDLFLRPELEENRALIRQNQTISLNAGDVLLFHCRLFHAAGKNMTDEVKLSPVFTYHAPSNTPIPGTRSASFPSIDVSGSEQ